MKKKKEQLAGLDIKSTDFTRSEKIILRCLAESALFSEFGVSNQEIMSLTSLSKRTMISAMQKFRKLNLLEEVRIGKTAYHKLTMNALSQFAGQRP